MGQQPLPLGAFAGMAPPRTYDRHVLPLNADVAEWCPQQGARRLLAVGTYQLNEATQQRQGAVHLFRLEGPAPKEAGQVAAAAGQPGGDQAAVGQDTEGASSLQSMRLVELSLLQLPGVFDLRWNPRSAMPQLAAALADGSVRVMTFDQTLNELASGPLLQSEVQLHNSSANSDEQAAEGMAVSLDYTRCTGCAGDQLAVSYSSGQLQLFQATPTGMASLAVWQAHQLEAWAAATDAWHPSLLHSGGDDCAYRLWDIRQGFKAPAWQSSKAHGAGVCCVASSPYQEHIGVTGSYDDHLRLWDLRAPQRPVQLAEVNMGGGVWRTKWHPADARLLLAACMYNGFVVLRVDGTSQDLSIAATYEHEPGALSYGADWCREALPLGSSSKGGCGTLAATCSFYDRQLHLWDAGIVNG